MRLLLAPKTKQSFQVRQPYSSLCDFVQVTPLGLSLIIIIKKYLQHLQADYYVSRTHLIIKNSASQRPFKIGIYIRHGELRHREASWYVQGLWTGSCHSQDLNPSCLAPESTPLSSALSLVWNTGVYHFKWTDESEAPSAETYNSRNSINGSFN